MISPFPQAFFAPAQDASEGSTERPASARTADEVRAGDEAPVEQGADSNAAGGDPMTFNSSGAVRYRTGPARTAYDIFFDSIRATVEAFDGR